MYGGGGGSLRKDDADDQKNLASPVFERRLAVDSRGVKHALCVRQSLKKEEEEAVVVVVGTWKGGCGMWIYGQAWDGWTGEGARTRGERTDGR